MSDCGCGQKPPFRCIACSSFDEELRTIFKEEGIAVDYHRIESSLHCCPERLQAAIQKVLDEDPFGECPTLLAFGDCHAQMEEQANHPHTTRLDAINCIHLLLGDETYIKFSERGALYLLPSWVDEFRQQLLKDTRLKEEILATFIQDLHKKLVYLDTGIMPIPEKKLQVLSDDLGIPYEIFPTPLDHLRERVLESYAFLTTSESLNDPTFICHPAHTS